ncbi:MAG TPA: helix-turn-helix transcriptional regulator [Dehalococcoidia bacterium]|nr:helix-turn-helix transcriptional regulator [Dehalococcoidia bacterium]
MGRGYLTQLLKGNTDVLILSLLQKEAMYGHQIMENLEAVSGGVLNLSEGTLYPALHRLVREGLIEGRWARLPNGKERKLYSLTRKGQGWLSDCLSTWGTFAHAMTQVTSQA